MSRQRALVLGASGLVGSHLLRAAAERGHLVVGTSHAQDVPGLVPLDVRDGDAVRKLVRDTGADIVFHAAASPNVDACEADPEGTAAVNVGGVRTAAEAAREVGARMVFFSSDYVFDGERGPYVETDPVNPIQEYGRQKVAAEAVCREVLPDAHLILRVTVVYGWERQGKNFVARLVRTLSEGGAMRVPADQFGSPTLADDLGDAAWELVDRDARGTFHVAGRDRVDRLAFARAAARAFGLPEGGIQGVTTAELGQRAPRPLNAGMRSGRAEAVIGRPMLGVDAGLSVLRSRWR
ncbi:MAG: rmlD 2 [Gemmatimonadetes bacterium]|nr:rmlD 2 [Gemmatimonadota bacterium]